MRYYIKKYLRDTFTSIILIISLAVTIFCSLNVSKYINSENDEESPYEYTRDLYFKSKDVLTEELIKFDELGYEERIALYKSDKCNVMGGMGVELAHNAVEHDGEVILYQNEEAPYRLISGSFLQDADEPVVYIGNVLLKYTYDFEDDTYIDIDGCRFLVAGIVESISIVDYSTTLLFDYKNLVKFSDIEEINNILNKIYLYYVGSNISEEDIDYTEEQIREHMALTDKNLLSEQMDFKSDSGYVYISNLFGSKLSMVSNILCIINAIIIVNIWVKHKRKEFAIRKAFGSSAFRIFLNLLWQFIKCFASAIVLGVGIQYIYSRLFNARFRFTDYFAGEGADIYLYIGVIFFGAILYHIGYISKIETKNGLTAK